MVRIFFAALLMPLAALANSELVGAESCRACHKEAYEIWRTSAHARAHESLPPEQRKNPLCLQCHSRDEPRSGQAQVTGVSCETCHGAGRSYQPEVVMRDKELARLFGLVDVTPASCLTCHNADSPSLRLFDAKEAMKRIDHWSKDRKPRAEREQPARDTLLARWLKARP